MVDVSDKATTVRTAMATGKITLSPQAMKLYKDPSSNPKGSVAAVAQIASIMAIKKTSDIIPLCHSLSVSGVDVGIETNDNDVIITVSVRSKGTTGVEMEALVGVSTGLLTIYDMTKSTGYEHVIKDIQLVNKKGGKSEFVK